MEGGGEGAKEVEVDLGLSGGDEEEMRNYVIIYNIFMLSS